MNKQEYLTVYWGCALTGTSFEHQDCMRHVMSHIKNYHPKVRLLEFLGTTAGTPEDVYIQDIEVNVASCDLFLNHVTLPSLGLGFELGVSVVHYQKKVVSFVEVSPPLPHEIKLTRLLQGATSRNPNYSILEYCGIDSLCKIIENILYEELKQRNLL